MSRTATWPLVAVLCAGCALATATSPQVEAATVELHGASLLDQMLGVTLCVINPNTSELSFRHIQVAMDVSGNLLAGSVSKTPVQLLPQSSVLVPFTVATTARNLVPQVLGVLRTGAVEWRLHGSITLDTPGITVPFSRGGRLDLLADGPRLLAGAVTLSTPQCAAARL